MSTMPEPVLNVQFFMTASGTEPVREWLMELTKPDRKVIGEDMKTVQFGWPLGMPLVRMLAPHLWEIRIHLHTRIARVLFTVDEGVMVLLHAFIKKSQETLREDLDLAKSRLKQARS
jgi:phage-related protein